MADAPIKTLIVEDNPDDLFLLRHLLESRGHEVEAYERAEPAVEAFGRERFGLILMDMVLPGISGLEACRRIRDLPGGDAAVIFFLTASERPGALEDALEAGGDDFLNKPINGELINLRLTIAERQVRDAREKEALARSAARDPLTRVANRTVFERRLDEAVRRMGREGEYLFAVLQVNLDRFREVNDDLGRGVGDQLLKEAALRLEDCVRGTDLVARSHGDEFLVFLDGLQDLSDPTRVARRIAEAFETPFLVADREVRLSASCGIALSLSGYTEPEQVLQDAEAAMERAKAEGLGSHQMFDPVMQARAQARVRLEGRIQDALDEGFLELWYQPFVSLSTGRILGFEALARIRDPERGLLLPGEFIPVAEESGLIANLGWWTLEEACRRLMSWQERFPGDEPLTMSVNLSPKQFARSDVYEQVRTRVRNLSLAHESLHLEITETALMTNTEMAASTLRKIRDLDIRIHVDDFGSGYSSMSYLCRFPIDALKIDRSFIRRMTSSPEDVEVVETIVRLADTLGIQVIAEGVEEEVQLERMRSFGCEVVQGFYFYRPMEAEQAEELLARERATA